MKKSFSLTVAALALAGAGFAQNASDYPPDAGPGTCFARVLVPEQSEVITEQVIDRPEAVDIKIIPAKYETVTERVVVKEASVKYKVVPAKYETRTEQVIATPERTETVVIPAEYETYQEKVLVRAAYTTWKPGEGLYGRTSTGKAADGTAVATGEVLCRVEVPAQYDTVERTRIKRPERSESRVIPATYKTITKEVVVQQPQVVEEKIPAEYDTVTVQKLVSPAREETIVIPATYKTVEKRVRTSAGGLEWREVLCDTNANPAKIAEIQRALTARGYAVKDDGDFGPATLRAMEAFQRANNLPVGYLTVSTVQALGVYPR